MRVQMMMIAAIVFAFNTVGCSQPKPVKAEYEPANCNCPESTAQTTPPARSDGLSDDAAASVVPTTILVADQAADRSKPSTPAANRDAVSTKAAPTKAVTKTKAKSDVASTGKINLNTATAVQLMQLPGVGPALAQRIVEFRKARRFEKPAHLLRVKGIGQSKYSKLAGLVTTTRASNKP